MHRPDCLLLRALPALIILCGGMYASPGIVPPVRSIQIGGQPFLEFIKYVMLCRRINTLVPQRLLRLANIALGELRAHKVAEVSYVALLCCSDNQNFARVSEKSSIVAG